MKKGFIKFSVIISSALLFIMSFSISVKADKIINNTYIIGLKVDVYDYESNTWKYTIGSDIDFKVDVNGYEYNFLGYDSNGNLKYQLPTGMNICNAGSGCKLILKTENLDITEHHNSTFYYKHTIIFNNHYVGTMKINNTSVAVNGTYYEWINTDNSNNGYTLSDFNLTSLHSNNWNFPIDSFSAVNYLLDDVNLDITGLQSKEYNMYIYPVFKLQANGYAMRANPMSRNNEGIFIFACNKDLTKSNFNTMFYFQQSEVVLKDVINVQTYGSGWGVYKVIVTKNGGTLSASLRPLIDMDFMPIFSGTSDTKNISTDFALQFGLKNEILENLNILANGNNQSQNAENENQQALDDTTNIIDNYNNLNSSIENDFNSNMENIDTSFNLNNYSGFVNSIDWVRVQFNNITSYDHVYILLTYALMIGLALLIMSRVL